MKTVVIIIVMFFLGTVGFAHSFMGVSSSADDDTEEARLSICPKTLMKNSCLSCHAVPDFSLKEEDPNRHLDLPLYSNVVNGKFVYRMDGPVEFGALARAIDWLSWHPDFKEMVLELHSPGGSLATAWRVVGMLEELKSRGVKITTRVHGFAASAAFIIFQAGDVREIGPLSEIMHHELWSVTWLSVDTPSSKEDEAKVMRHLQTTIHKWLVTRCSKPITVEELDLLVHKKDYWMNGEDALEAGFADKYIGE